MSEEKNTDVTPQGTSLINDERMLASFCHLGGLVGLLFPPLNIVIPLILYLIYRDKYELVADQGKESVNFQLSLFVFIVIGVLLVFVAIGIVVLPLIMIYALVVIIIAALRARDGEKYRYPLTFRFIP